MASQGATWVYNPQHGHTAVWARRENDGRWTYADQQGNPVDEATANGRAGQAATTSSSPQDAAASTVAPQQSSSRPEARPTAPPVYDEPPPKGSLAEDDPEPEPEPMPEPVDEHEDGEVPSKPTSSRAIHSASLRLVLLPQSRTTSFPAPQNLVILPPNPDQSVSIGRDKLEWGHRIRIKDLEVSKNHATLFWKRERDFEMGGAWYLVDNGSMYGTFVTPRPRHGSGEDVEEKTEPERLSEPKKASRPHRLRHMETILIASANKPFAAFEVHWHRETPITCTECALRADEKNRIRTDDSSSAAPSPHAAEASGSAPVMTSSSHVAAPALIGDESAKDGEDKDKYTWSSADVKAEREKKRKADMKSLRTHFFGDEEPKADGGWAKMKKKTKLAKGNAGAVPVLGAVEAGPSPYVDRAKARRLAHGPSADEPPPSSFYGPDGRGVKGKAPAPAPAPAPPAPPVPKPDPFAASSKGAAMLAKLSGTAVSSTSSGPPILGQLVEARSMHSSPLDRAGLGSREVVTGVEQVAARSGGGDWRESVREASRKRFREM